MLRSGLIATKIGNSSYYHEDGKNTHVTILKVDECIVASVKASNKDGYNAIQVGYDNVSPKKLTNPKRRLPFIFSSEVIKCATTTLNRGVIALRIESTPEATRVCLQTIKLNDMTLFNIPIPPKAIQILGFLGNIDL